MCAKRRRRRLLRFRAGDESISDAGLRTDERPGPSVRRDLPAQVRDVKAEHLGVRRVARSPYVAQHRLVGHHLAAVLNEDAQEVVLDWREAYLAPAGSD